MRKKYDSEILNDPLLLQLDNLLLQLQDSQPLTEIIINVIHSQFYKKFLFSFMLEKINNAANDAQGFVIQNAIWSHIYRNWWEIPLHSGKVLIDADYNEEIFSDSYLHHFHLLDENDEDYILCVDYNKIRVDLNPITFCDIITHYIKVPRINSEQLINILVLRCDEVKGINFIKKLIKEYLCIFNNIATGTLYKITINE